MPSDPIVMDRSLLTAYSPSVETRLTRAMAEGIEPGTVVNLTVQKRRAEPRLMGSEPQGIHPVFGQDYNRTNAMMVNFETLYGVSLEEQKAMADSVIFSLTRTGEPEPTPPTPRMTRAELLRKTDHD